MTKKQWNEILQELKTMRSTNKFRADIVYYSDSTPLHRELNVGQRIDTINIDEEYIKFAGNVYMRHDDVLNTSPNETRDRFFVTMDVFNIDKVEFKSWI